jgi:hypothetical protein
MAIKGGVVSYGGDRIAVKVYGLLVDAGYYANLNLDWKGYVLIWAIKPKEKCFHFESARTILRNGPSRP